MIIQHTGGQENFEGAGSKAFAFFIPSRQHEGQEGLIFQAAKNGAGGLKQRGPSNIVRASSIAPDNRLGTWTDVAYDIDEGAVLKLFGSRKASWSTLNMQGVMLVRARSEAALRRVEMNTLRVVNSTRPRVCLLEGRFDILSVEEAVANGVNVQPHVARLMERADTVFQTTVLAAEEVSLQQTVRRRITNSAGERVEITLPKKRRMLDAGD